MMTPPRYKPNRNRRRLTAVGPTILLATILVVGWPIWGVARAEEPPRVVPVEETEWERLSNHLISERGRTALQMNPDRWRHAETDHFILHFRRLTEARPVAREIEYYLWYVASALEADPEDYARKSHVYIFEDEREWRRFLQMAGIPQWTVSFAIGDELFLNVRRQRGSERFDSQTLAHETTHAVVARLFPQARWPLWLNEGFAEYMGSASVAAHRRQTVGRHQARLTRATMSLSEMAALERYPEDPLQISRLYQSAEALVRFLIEQHGMEPFRLFVLQVIAEGDPEAALLTVYEDDYTSLEDFERHYERRR